MNLNQKTRWRDLKHGHRLLCNNEDCSLSCANILNGRLSVTSIHGTERHTYQLEEDDMLFLILEFLSSLAEDKLIYFCKLFNKKSEDFLLNLEKLT